MGTRLLRNVLLLSFLFAISVQAQDLQDIQVTVTDEALTPLDSIYVALINHISSDTLENLLTNENGMAEFLEVVVTSDEIEPSIPCDLDLKRYRIKGTSSFIRERINVFMGMSEHPDNLEFALTRN